MAEADRSQDPERNLEDDVHQSQRDEHVGQPLVGQPEQPGGAEPAGSQEHPYTGDQSQGLRDLDGQHSGEGFPPPASDAIRLRQGVADQSQRSGDDQNHRQGHADDVREQQAHQDHDDDDPHQNCEEVAAVGAEGTQHEVA
ncbi:hypothetical protein [Streptomyces sp. Y7]|uniref:hypothetical protein n=1 Tax=Streptomyces sp. Y7 TaxID=3342392 RepID=UPI00371247A9